MKPKHTSPILRRQAHGLLILSLIYLGASVWLERSRTAIGLDGIPASPLLYASLLSLLSFSIRYLRWRRILVCAGCAIPWWQGYLAYVAGFAFTATPGKLGELVRIRFHQRFGVPPWRVVGAFVYERAADLLVLTVLAAVGSLWHPAFAVAAVFVFIILAVLSIVWLRPSFLRGAVRWVRQSRLRRAEALVVVLWKGLRISRCSFSPRELLFALGLGLSAWTLTSVAFLMVLQGLSLHADLGFAWSVYPLALLTGAASMVPGGLGTTEGAIVLLLGLAGIPSRDGILAALIIRAATLWLAIACGVGAAALLNATARRRTQPDSGAR